MRVDEKVDKHGGRTGRRELGVSLPSLTHLSLISSLISFLLVGSYGLQ